MSTPSDPVTLKPAWSKGGKVVLGIFIAIVAVLALVVAGFIGRATAPGVVASSASANSTVAKVASSEVANATVEVVRVNGVDPEKGSNVLVEAGDSLDLTLTVNSGVNYDLKVSSVNSELGLQYDGPQVVKANKTATFNASYTVAKSAIPTGQLNEVVTVEFDNANADDAVTTAAWGVNQSTSTQDDVVNVSNGDDANTVDAVLTANGLTDFTEGWDNFDPSLGGGRLYGAHSFCPGLDSKAALQACLDSGTAKAEDAIRSNMEQSGLTYAEVKNADNWQIRQFPTAEVAWPGNTGYVNGAASAPYGLSTGKVGEAVLTITGPNGVGWNRLDCGNPQTQPPKAAPTPPAAPVKPVTPVTPTTPVCPIDSPVNGGKVIPPGSNPEEYCNLEPKATVPVHNDDPEAPDAGGEGLPLTNITCDNVDQMFADGKLTLDQYKVFKATCKDDTEPPHDPDPDIKCDDGLVMGDDGQCKLPDVVCPDNTTVPAGTQCPQSQGGEEDSDGTVEDGFVVNPGPMVPADDTSTEQATEQETAVANDVGSTQPVADSAPAVETVAQPAPAAEVNNPVPAPVTAPDPAPAPVAAPDPPVTTSSAPAPNVDAPVVADVTLADGAVTDGG